MCVVGEFKPTEFVDNNSDVLASVPEKEKGVKNQDLLLGPEENAEGFLWNTKQDLLGFHINLEEKTSTRKAIG